MMKERGMEVVMPCVPEIVAFDDDKLGEAFANLESSMKMDLNQIAISEEHIHRHRLEIALTFLSIYCSDNGPLFHGLRLKIDSLHHEIRTTMSSFKQASATLDTLNKLEEKEKLVDEKYSQQMEAAINLVSEISNTKKGMAELKEEILQAQLNSKEKEFKGYEVKFSSLEQQKEEQVSDTMGLMEEYEVVKKDKSRVVEGQTKARREVEKVKNDWPSCVANLRKTTLLLAILLKRKL
ncbi:uncharacterized protein LOC129285964 [Prosopis cineraria]|uniref:uncharacterized protein LOC129285964 n=1 Tax=Prosopis cineraria TaxID=364024 RepID=UPI00240F2A13|nr:uncharacterized protein LOC129285964 [Prosopis cineraria]XP_054777942.1 uncharacterized protein LOC129285964 [Prosopis cineraria]XP_054777943.1 uncharacterized protein LOC129285964 [Prosopis cineraria]XP_054777944.1 uncharacterized protein LOC129285964 [Prosopis cineraria]XP_054777945.1 uncharacterized protein LOC129285964 [Prosopis cineraria]XP_054777946.1 uncharacterized protein LOC129285964 [Prosopis cineraria]XP_054777947.1 uncharacterized protein LOC129285964 [Prosopis cineraria]